jgi:hypothetical protein
MELLIVIIAIAGWAAIGKMTYDMANYQDRNPWVWAILAVLFGPLVMAYVFYNGKYKY